LNKFLIKPANCGAFCETCSITGTRQGSVKQVIEQVQYVRIFEFGIAAFCTALPNLTVRGALLAAQRGKGADVNGTYGDQSGINA
jgi:hypothetical protein